MSKILTRLLVLQILTILSLVSGCNSSEDLTQLKELSIAKSKWQNNQSRYYNFRYQRSCECPSESSAPMLVSFLDNELLGAHNLTSDSPVSDDISAYINSVDELFVLIEQALNDGLEIEARYHIELGYPEIARIDQQSIAVDGGLAVTLSDLSFEEIDKALDDVSWQLTSFNTIAGPQPVLENTSLTLQFDGDNLTLGGSAGCNGFSGSYSAEAASISISGFVQTEIWCDIPEGIMTQETNYLSSLYQMQNFHFSNGQLNLEVGADSGLTFSKLATNPQ